MNGNKLTAVFEDIIQKVNAAADKGGHKIEDFIQNDEALRPILIAAYSRMPFFLRIILREDRFVSFVMNNKEKLLIHKEIGKVVSEMINKFK